jgi:hypothetical protein
MDKFLKLKLEMVYRDFQVELARQTFEELKALPPKEVPKPKRKLRIVVPQNK